jgi:hypothetical protein
METAMSDLFDEYPMLMFALEALIALFLLVFIVVWTASGKKKAARQHSARTAPEASQDAASSKPRQG